MPPIDEPETPPAEPAPPPPPPAPEAPVKSLFLATSDVFGRLAGTVWSLTPAQASEGGDALRPATDDELRLWGRPPLVRD